MAVCRDDSFSILGMIELSRRFSNGLWNCIQVLHENQSSVSKSFLLMLMDAFFSLSLSYNNLCSFGYAVDVVLLL